MAENKKGFLMYADWQSTIQHLTDEQAGKLLKHLLSYVNDENPKCDDPIIKICFEPIKTQLKRDLEKWEKVRENRRKAGRKSAESRAKKKSEHMLTGVEGVQQESTPVNTTQQSPTKSTVNVNDNVNDNVSVNVNDILLEKETKDVYMVWLDYRKEIKKPIKSEKTKISLAKRFQKEGAKVSKWVVENSISNGWQGLFWDKFIEGKKEKKSEKKEKKYAVGRMTHNDIAKNVDPKKWFPQSNIDLYGSKNE